eukprot:TRINITY_DN4326_c0_g1_i13.p1 TRINITY_DN4326_c0_g1~~TRINITY_DN4326_c0_g1_i13.p1  ORF type:complete len:186 (+),score=-21.91 TRINITY_DN4326_c0_g1_i13:1594-2151(+)
MKNFNQIQIYMITINFGGNIDGERKWTCTICELFICTYFRTCRKCLCLHQNLAKNVKLYYKEIDKEYIQQICSLVIYLYYLFIIQIYNINCNNILFYIYSIICKNVYLYLHKLYQIITFKQININFVFLTNTFIQQYQSIQNNCTASNKKLIKINTNFYFEFVQQFQQHKKNNIIFYISICSTFF